eukprot:Sspe_Gene.50890::Locus_28275_Transcript_1_1_Confidence_1.000_Length_369::g.50890::m.50890
MPPKPAPKAGNACAPLQRMYTKAMGLPLEDWTKTNLTASIAQAYKVSRLWVFLLCSVSRGEKITINDTTTSRRMTSESHIYLHLNPGKTRNLVELGEVT